MLDKLKHVLANHVEHIVRSAIRNFFSSQIPIWNLLLRLQVQPHLSSGNVGLASSLSKSRAFLFLLNLLVIQQFHEEDISHLLQYRDWISDTCHKDSIPYLIDLVLISPIIIRIYYYILQIYKKSYNHTYIHQLFSIQQNLFGRLCPLGLLISCISPNRKDGFHPIG